MVHWPSSEGFSLRGTGLAVRASAYGSLAYRILVHRIIMLREKLVLTDLFQIFPITERTTIKNNFLEFKGPRTELILVS